MSLLCRICIIDVEEYFSASNQRMKILPIQPVNSLQNVRLCGSLLALAAVDRFAADGLNGLALWLFWERV